MLAVSSEALGEDLLFPEVRTHLGLLGLSHFIT